LGEVLGRKGNSIDSTLSTLAVQMADLAYRSIDWECEPNGYQPSIVASSASFPAR